MDYNGFLDYLHTLDEEFFIEAEAKERRMNNFINDYNSKYSPSIDINSEGICLLGDNVDKWGLELRIYLNDISNMPSYWVSRKYRNSLYHVDEFSYRIDDNDLIYVLFNAGYRIGYN